jgi:glutathione-specific gamma-glutamylcyclotransferase
MMQEHWVFGYGSLMWRPGFPFAERRRALLRGLHRRLCIYSHVHRGTPEHPGLVMGLDRGGACHGIAYRVAGDAWKATLAYLREREQVTSVYLEMLRPIALDPEAGAAPRRVEAVVYVADRRHPQYAGKLGIEEQLPLVRQGVGISGACVDYVRSAAEHIREMGLRDPLIEGLSARL